MRAARSGRNRSIGGRLNALVLLSIGATLLCVSCLTVWGEADRFLAGKRERLLATARVFAAASSKAVAAGNPAAVNEVLRGLARFDDLRSADVQDRSGAPLASLGSAVTLGSDLALDDSAAAPFWATLRTGTVRVTVPIVEGGETVGRLSLVAGTDGFAGSLGATLARAGIGSAFALSLGLILALRLKRAIVRPLATLSAAMAGVERTGAYQPVPVTSEDETGYLARRFNGMIDEIRRGTDELLAREEEIITRLSRAGELRDDQTGQHVVRVAKISRLIAEGLRLDPAFVDDLCRASPMHDVGKISVSDAILFKPGRLDPEERRQMERHARAGHAILAGSGARLVQLAAEIAISHHERWDGGGYPNGLAGEAIPLSGRITAVADVCDALLSTRPYKQPWPLPSVRAHLVENAGKHFDPACVEALLAAWPALEAIYEPGTEVAQAA